MPVDAPRKQSIPAMVMPGRSSAVDAFMLEVRPETAAGGFPRDDGTFDFYGRIAALLRPDMVVLNLGAGRGALFETAEDRFPHNLSRLKGRVAKLIGADLDPVVLSNPQLDEAHVISPTEPVPFGGETFDLVFSDWVLEHVEDPNAFAAEIERILKPGGWFCARTPSKWGYIALAARLLPGRLHGGVLQHVQSARSDQDVFPKYYRLNTLGAVAGAFPSSRFRNATYTHNPTPAYHGNRRLLFTLVEAFQKIPIRALDTTLHIFIQKTA